VRECGINQLEAFHACHVEIFANIRCCFIHIRSLGLVFRSPIIVSTWNDLILYRTYMSEN